MLGLHQMGSQAPSRWISDGRGQETIQKDIPLVQVTNGKDLNWGGVNGNKRELIVGKNF